AKCHVRLDVIRILNPAQGTGDLLRAKGDRVAHAGFVQAGQGSSRGHSTHRRDGTFDAAVAAPYGLMSKRDYETATDIIAKDYRSEQFHSRALFPLRHGHGG